MKKIPKNPCLYCDDVMPESEQVTIKKWVIRVYRFAVEYPFNIVSTQWRSRYYWLCFTIAATKQVELPALLPPPTAPPCAGKSPNGAPKPGDENPSLKGPLIISLGLLPVAENKEQT